MTCSVLQLPRRVSFSDQDPRASVHGRLCGTGSLQSSRGLVFLCAGDQRSLKRSRILFARKIAALTVHRHRNLEQYLPIQVKGVIYTKILQYNLKYLPTLVLKARSPWTDTLIRSMCRVFERLSPPRDSVKKGACPRVTLIGAPD